MNTIYFFMLLGIHTYVPTYFVLNMDYKKSVLPFLAFVVCAYGIKVNMTGSLNLNRDVLETLTNYMKTKMHGGRRSALIKDPDVLFLMVKATYLCKGLDLCDGVLENFVNEYVAFQTKSIETVFQTVHPNLMYLNVYTDEDIRTLHGEIRAVLEKLDAKIHEEIGSRIWSEVLKKICVIFQRTSVRLALDRLATLKGEVDTDDLKKTLAQKLIIATIIVEGRFEIKLCDEYEICPKSFECTKALHILLTNLIETDEEKIGLFIRYLAEWLIDTPFYSKLNAVTAIELESILNDIAYTKGMPTKRVLAIIHKALATRLDGLNTNNYTAVGKEEQLVHAIMSDMDYVYRSRTVDPFHVFLSNFFEWKVSGTKLAPSVKMVLKDISDQLSKQPEDLTTKIMNEVKTFLEINIDPEE